MRYNQDMHENQGKQAKRLAILSPTHSRQSLRIWMSLADTNHAGNVHGGAILKLVDEAAALAASRHTKTRVVTAALDSMTFDRPVHIGDLLIVESQVNQAWGSSMEVGVRVLAEEIPSGICQQVATAYLTMVSLDDQGHTAAVPPLILENDEDLRHAADADRRRAHRLAKRDK